MKIDINIHTATDIIETVRQYLAERVAPEVIEKDLQERFKIDPITKCTGEAHSNPMGYDHCMSCMPRWGWSGPKITVRARMPKVIIPNVDLQDGLDSAKRGEIHPWDNFVKFAKEDLE
jgi:hypothetical protein